MGQRMKSTAEKRREERFTLRLFSRVEPVQVGEKESALLELLTRDICSGGAYFQTETPLALGTQVKIDIVLPLKKIRKIEGKQARIQACGSVIRSTEGGMAIRFDRNCIITPCNDAQC